MIIWVKFTSENLIEVNDLPRPEGTQLMKEIKEKGKGKKKGKRNEKKKEKQKETKTKGN